MYDVMLTTKTEPSVYTSQTCSCRRCISCSRRHFKQL